MSKQNRTRNMDDTFFGYGSVSPSPSQCTEIWTEERVERLKSLWQEGLSASQIAVRLGGTTRNGVIGKVHRLGLSARAAPGRRTRSYHKSKVAPTPPRQKFASKGNKAFRELFKQDAEPCAPPVEELVIPLKERKYILTLTDSCCHWPIGDPQHADFHFCGKSAVTGLPYCEHHARRAFQPPQTNQKNQPAKQPAKQLETA